MLRPPPSSTLFPYTTLFRSDVDVCPAPGTQMDPNMLLAKVVATNMRERFSEIRSEEHTSELQSRGHLVCRLLLEKKKKKAENKTNKIQGHVASMTSYKKCHE